MTALVGGPMGSTLAAKQVQAELPWHPLVVLPQPEDALTQTTAALATAR